MRQFHPDVIDSVEIRSDSVSSAEAAHPAGRLDPRAGVFLPSKHCSTSSNDFAIYSCAQVAS